MATLHRTPPPPAGDKSTRKAPPHEGCEKGQASAIVVLMNMAAMIVALLVFVTVASGTHRLVFGRWRGSSGTQRSRGKNVVVTIIVV